MIECAALIMGVHIASAHLRDERKLNSFNPGVYASCDEYTVGLYKNSYKRESVYVARSFGPLAIGLVTGYPKGAVLPMAVLSVKWQGIRLSLIPPVDKTTGAVHVSYEWGIK